MNDVLPGAPRNVSAVRPPNWTGDEHEWAIVVSRGEPTRSNAQMREVIGDQVEQYLTRFAHPVPPEGVRRGVADWIARDYASDVGQRRVAIRADHLMLYVAAVTGGRSPE